MKHYNRLVLGVLAMLAAITITGGAGTETLASLESICNIRVWNIVENNCMCEI